VTQGPADSVAARAAVTIRASLAEHADPVRAAATRAYLKHDAPHLGVQVPQVRAVVRSTVRAEPSLGMHDPLVELVDLLWTEPEFELRLAAVEALATRPAAIDHDDLPRLEAMLRGCGTWALVDPIAAGVVGRLVVRDPEDPVLVRVLERWAVDDDFWLRRSALLSQLDRVRAADAKAADFALFARWADGMLGEREFFVRKAIGWVLRETSKHHPDRVAQYVRPRLDRMSGVTFREAVRRLPPGTADELRHAWVAR
jgi:3-methyladenine DNA glycosylase AlkD